MAVCFMGRIQPDVTGAQSVMATSQRVRFNELRRCMRLVNDCRDQGRDASSWRLGLLEELRLMLGAQVGICSEMRDFAKGKKAKVIGAVRTGWESIEAERAWKEYVKQVPLERTPEYAPLINAKGPVVTRSRNQLWPDAAWYHSRAFNEFHRASGVDDYIISIHHVPNRGTSSSIWIHRPVGDKGFTRRDRTMVQIVHQHIAPLIGTSLASCVDPSPTQLSPRRREVLNRLLGGDSEKQIGATLGITRATAHEHVSAIYRHFGVSSRAELMAKFMSRPADA